MAAAKTTHPCGGFLSLYWGNKAERGQQSLLHPLVHPIAQDEKEACCRSEQIRALAMQDLWSQDQAHRLTNSERGLETEVCSRDITLDGRRGAGALSSAVPFQGPSAPPGQCEQQASVSSSAASWEVGGKKHLQR